MSNQLISRMCPHAYVNKCVQYVLCMSILLLVPGFGEIISEDGLMASANGLEESPILDAYSAVGRGAFLPCDVTPPRMDDSPLLVLIFKDNKPIYSVDAREVPISQAVHWTAPMMEKRKPSFEASSPPHGLVIPSVEAGDAGEYHCRVDFMASPTRNLRIRLHVSEPPESIKIFNNNGKEVAGRIGPYPLGDTVTLTCVVSGGNPRPRVTWWHKGSLVDEVMEESVGLTSSNYLTMPNLTRGHLGWVVSCQAVNSNLTSAITASVEIDMTFPPSEISIEGVVRALKEGEPQEMLCQSSGSRPGANITWWMNNEPLPVTNEQIISKIDSTVSKVTLIPRREDDGSVVSCRAENALLPSMSIEDTRKLIVFYPPKLTLRSGRNIYINKIKEGDDVYFECLIEANPRVYRIEWFLSGSQIRHNVSAGVIISNQSLVLQRIDRSFSGELHCSGSNRLGSAISNTLKIAVRYPPSCVADQQELYGAAPSSSINITCQVTGEPLPETFRWALNATSEMEKIPSRVFKGLKNAPGESVLFYHPETHNDFGWLFCWGHNEVGRQAKPCAFKIVPAARPESPRNCSVFQNISEGAGSVAVSCSPGWDGGLPQKFSLEVRRSISSPILAALREQETPTFSISGLPPGVEFHLSVVASNAQGVSQPTEFVHFTPIDIAEERLSASSTLATGWSTGLVGGVHLIGVIVGVLIVLGVSCGVVLLVVKARAATHSLQPKERAVTEIKDDSNYGDSGPDVIYIGSDGKNLGSEKQLSTERLLKKDNADFRPSDTGPKEVTLMPASQETEELLPTSRPTSKCITWEQKMKKSSLT